MSPSNPRLDVKDIFPQGEGSTLDADTVDGRHYDDLVQALDEYLSTATLPWDRITGKPEFYEPAKHTHVLDLSNFKITVTTDPKTGKTTTTITGKKEAETEENEPFVGTPESDPDNNDETLDPTRPITVRE